MSRRSVSFARGEYYHVYNRGAGRRNIFFEPDNYQYVLRKSYHHSRKFQLSIIAYCLLPNHYHYLIRQDGEIPVSKFPQSVFGGYSRALHYRQDKSGTLFEGRYMAKHILTDQYLLQLCCYIHANPVNAGLVLHAEDWPYSDYFEWLRWHRMEVLGDQKRREILGESISYQEVFDSYLQASMLPDELSYLEDY